MTACCTGETRSIPRAGRIRVECAKCGRLVGWAEPIPLGPGVATRDVVGATPNVATAPSPSSVPPGSPADLPADPLNISPDAWFYVSKRLDLEWVPNAPVWSAPVIHFGAVPYYRASPAVVAWLEQAGFGLERQFLAGQLERDQMDAYLAAMDQVWAFASQCLSSREVSAARRAGKPVLPEVPTLPLRPTPAASASTGRLLVRVVNVTGLNTPEKRAAVCYVGCGHAGWPDTPWGNHGRLPCPDGFKNHLLAMPAGGRNDLLVKLWEACGEGKRPLGCWCCDWSGEGVTPGCHAAVWAELLNTKYASGRV